MLQADKWGGARLLAGLLPAAAVTLSLLWGMQYLLSSGDSTLREPRARALLDFVRLQRERVPERQPRLRPDKPPPTQAPPPEPPLPQLQQTTPAPGSIAVAAPRVAIGIDLQAGGFSLGTGDGDYLPILKVAPNYPQRAINRGIEGHCTVQYTVTLQGSTREVRVLEGQCTHELFQEPSLQAARNFKYKPRVIDGQAVQVTGVRNRFVYRLEEAR